MNWVLITLKWASQVLIVTTGVYGLLSDLYRTDSTTRRRRLTRGGKIALTSMTIGFVTFAGTDIHERLEASRKEEDSKQLIQVQKDQLAQLRRLALGQNRLAGLSVEWDLSSEVYQQAEEVLKTHFSHESVRGYILLMLKGPGFPGGWLIMRTDRAGEREFHVEIHGPLGDAVTTYRHGKPEWEAFNQLMKTILSPRFAITLEQGTTLLRISDERDLGRDSEQGASELEIRSGRIRITLHEANLVLSQLENAKFVFQRSGAGITGIPNPPSRIRVKSLDSNAVFDQTYDLDWRQEEQPGSSYLTYDPRLGEYVSNRWFVAGPYSVSVTFSPLLVPATSQER